MNKYDNLVNQYLTESYFGGSPYNRSSGLKTHVDGKRQLANEEEDEKDFLSAAEVKAIQSAHPKKRSSIQQVDKNQLSPAGRELMDKVLNSVDMYQRGSAIKGDASLRTSQLELEDNALEDAFGSTTMDYVAWDKSEGYNGAHVYRYPNSASHLGVPYDKDGFRVEVHSPADRTDELPEEAPLYPLDQWDIVNFFAKGSNDPFTVKGRTTS